MCFCICVLLVNFRHYLIIAVLSRMYRLFFWGPLLEKNLFFLCVILMGTFEGERGKVQKGI